MLQLTVTLTNSLICRSFNLFCLFKFTLTNTVNIDNLRLKIIKLSGFSLKSNNVFMLLLNKNHDVIADSYFN